MNATRLLRVFSSIALVAASAAAQTGLVDQVSPYPGPAGSTAWFNTDASSLVWQMEVSAGQTGTLEGIELVLGGSIGSHIDLRVRMGAGWSTNPAVFTTQVIQQTASTPELYFVDTTSANIAVAPGTLFVIEVQGNNDGGGILGTYVTPPGTPNYPQPLFLNGPGCFTDCGWRQAFTTYVLPPVAVTPMCFGNACPCANDDANAGCRNSTGVGALLVQSGGTLSIALDDLAMHASQMTTNQSALMFMGNAQINAPWADGRRCAAGQVWRFPINTTGPAGSLNLIGPVGQSAGLITSGSSWIFQSWYRDPVGPCLHHVNMSNGLKCQFGP